MKKPNNEDKFTEICDLAQDLIEDNYCDDMKVLLEWIKDDLVARGVK